MAVADVIDPLAVTLTGHLGHEERNGLSAGSEMFAWMLDGTGRDQAAATLGSLPPPLRLLYRALWKPRYDKTSRW
jgi:hypothetical protein